MKRNHFVLYDGLLAGSLETLRKPLVGLRRLSYKYSGRIGMGVAVIVLICALLASYFVTAAFVNRYIAAAKALPVSATPNFDVVAREVQFLIGIIASGMWTRYAVYVIGLFVVSIILAIVCGAFVSAYAETTRPSFVLLTKQTDEFRRTELQKCEQSWWIFIFSLFGSIFISVIGNLIFYEVLKLWSL